MKRIILAWGIFLFLSSFVYPNTDDPKKIGETTKEALARIDSTVFSEQLYTIAEGTLLEITQEKYDWYKVRLPRNYFGFVHSSYVKQVNSRKGISEAENLNIRSNPSFDAPIIGKLNKNDVIKIVAKRNEWYEIQAYPYASAWIHKKSLKIVPKKDQDELITQGNTTKVKPLQPEVLPNLPIARGMLKRKKRLFAKAQYNLQTENQLISLKLSNNDDLSKFINNKVDIWGKFINEDKLILVVERIELTE